MNSHDFNSDDFSSRDVNSNAPADPSPPPHSAARRDPQPAPPEWNDQRIEILLGRLLRSGVLLSASVVFLGGIVYLVRHGRSVADYRVFRGELSPLRTLPGVLHGTRQFSGAAIIQLGILMLIATPIARVLFSAVAFTRERDYLYTLLTLAVLAILTYSLFGASLH